MFEKPRVCKTCKKELSEFEGCQIPVYIPASPHFGLPSGGVDLYCEACYQDATGETLLQVMKENIAEDKDFESRIKAYREEHNLLPISAAVKGTNVSVVARISSGLQHNDLNKDGKPLRMSFCQLKDDTEKITLILWNSEHNFKVGEFYLINGYIQEFNGQRQLTLGYRGRMERLFV